jgi:hypothetical protein
LLPSSSAPEFLRDLWITKILFAEIEKVEAQSVLHFALAEIVQVPLPVAILGQIFRYMR